jgi:fructose-1,6-bisphosphatase/inositol monophosphatase family enzyme
MSLRGEVTAGREAERQQLKTPADLAAEGWVTGLLRGLFPADALLAEEAFEGTHSNWDPPQAFWTIDALDGSRSFVEGFAGFCTQVAYVDCGHVALSAIHEPVAGITYWAARSKGAFLRKRHGEIKRLMLDPRESWPTAPRFVDSTPPKGAVGRLMERRSGRFIECGSIGLKICRVASGEADIYAKELSFALWDIAPGRLILEEAGGYVGLWNGRQVPLDVPQVYYENILAAPSGLFERAVRELE